jgi:hypothetical protein
LYFLFLDVVVAKAGIVNHTLSKMEPLAQLFERGIVTNQTIG